MLPSPDQNLKIGSVCQFFYIFFTYRERVEFSNIFFKVSKWGKLGRNAVKMHMGQNFERCTIGHFQTLSTFITPGSPPVTQKPFILVSS